MSGKNVNRTLREKFPSSDLLTKEFILKAQKASKAVCHIKSPDGSGSGFLVADNIILTNNHVIATEEKAKNSTAWFFYDDRNSKQPKEGEHGVAKFDLDPQALFITSPLEDLDFTFVALKKGQNKMGAEPLSLHEHIFEKGSLATIIHHPHGLPKKITLRENFVCDSGPKFVRYTVATEHGSSGSPVFNDALQVVALHHGATRDPSGVDQIPVLQGEKEVPFVVNEAVQVVAILKKLREWPDGTGKDAARAVLKALGKGEANKLQPEIHTPQPSSEEKASSEHGSPSTRGFREEALTGQDETLHIDYLDGGLRVCPAACLITPKEQKQSEAAPLASGILISKALVATAASAIASKNIKDLVVTFPHQDGAPTFSIEKVTVSDLGFAVLKLAGQNAGPIPIPDFGEYTVSLHVSEITASKEGPHFVMRRSMVVSEKQENFFQFWQTNVDDHRERIGAPLFNDDWNLVGIRVQRGVEMGQKSLLARVQPLLKDPLAQNVFHQAVKGRAIMEFVKKMEA